MSRYTVFFIKFWNDNLMCSDMETPLISEHNSDMVYSSPAGTPFVFSWPEYIVVSDIEIQAVTMMNHT